MTNTPSSQSLDGSIPPVLPEEVRKRFDKLCKENVCDGKSCLPVKGSHIYKGFLKVLASEIVLAKAQGAEEATEKINKGLPDFLTNYFKENNLEIHQVTNKECKVQELAKIIQIVAKNDRYVPFWEQLDQPPTGGEEG